MINFSHLELTTIITQIAASQDGVFEEASNRKEKLLHLYSKRLSTERKMKENLSIETLSRALKPVAVEK